MFETHTHTTMAYTPVTGLTTNSKLKSNCITARTMLDTVQCVTCQMPKFLSRTVARGQENVSPTRSTHFRAGPHSRHSLNAYPVLPNRFAPFVINFQRFFSPTLHKAARNIRRAKFRDATQSQRWRLFQGAGLNIGRRITIDVSFLNPRQIPYYCNECNYMNY